MFRPATAGPMRQTMPSAPTSRSVPAITTTSRGSHRLDRVESLGACADSDIILNKRLGAADLGVTHLLAVLALNSRVCSQVSAYHTIGHLISENSQSRGLGHSLDVCPYSSQLRHWMLARLRGLSHSLAMWPSSPQLRHVRGPPLGLSGQSLEKWPTARCVSTCFSRADRGRTYSCCRCGTRRWWQNGVRYLRQSVSDWYSLQSMVERTHNRRPCGQVCRSSCRQTCRYGG